MDNNGNLCSERLIYCHEQNPPLLLPSAFAAQQLISAEKNKKESKRNGFWDECEQLRGHVWPRLVGGGRGEM